MGNKSVSIGVSRCVLLWLCSFHQHIISNSAHLVIVWSEPFADDLISVLLFSYIDICVRFPRMIAYTSFIIYVPTHWISHVYRLISFLKYIYIYIYINIYLYKYIYIYKERDVYTSIIMYIYIAICEYISVYIYIIIDVYTSLSLYIYIPPHR